MRKTLLECGAFFVAQRLDAMWNDTGTVPDRKPIKTRSCDPGGGWCEMKDFILPLDKFIDTARLILDKNNNAS